MKAEPMIARWVRGLAGRRLGRGCGVILMWLLAPAFLVAQKPIESVFTHRPPRIDGRIDVGEWEEAKRLPLENGYVAILNDRKRAYFLINVWDQRRDDAADYLWLSFDVNRDRLITAGEDVNFALDPDGRTLGIQTYLGSGRLSEWRPVGRSSVAAGFDSFVADGSTRLEGGRLAFRAHRIWEVAIDLDEIKSRAGNRARFGLRVVSPATGLTLEPVRNFTNDFASLIEVEWAAGALVEVLPDVRAVVRLQRNFLELSQTVQTRENDIPLVAGKPTIARIYASVLHSVLAQPVRVYLHGRRQGIELPGSPLVRDHYLPPIVQRGQLAGTPWFALPDSWLAGTVEFRVRLVDAQDREEISDPLSRTFHVRRVPLIWIVPVNTGSAAAPVLVSSTEIASQMSYLRATYPVADVDFVIKPWTVLGAHQSVNPIPQLRTYHASLVLAWVAGLLTTGSSPFDLPMQIYGFTPAGGGESDPVWYYGTGHGYVARGYRGTSLEGTMAHEINHNLDRSAAGTWGRHVPGGCGATGPDSAWPYSNDDINEYGMDTRANPDDPVERVILPQTWPDFMSYCQSGSLPTKWISPYRYLALYDVFAPLPGGVGRHETRLLAAGIQQNLLHLSGTLHRSGSGRLYPILVQPGAPSGEPGGGAYAIELRESSGRPLRRLAFDANFEPLCEDAAPEELAFDFQVAHPRGMAAAVLLHKDRVLDEITVSRNAPTVTVTSPNGGERWSGVQTITWTAADADRGSVLAFNIQYSADGGRSWIPVAERISGRSYPVDTARLPGSDRARMRILVTDGVHTAQDDSDAGFIVTGKPPQPFILTPLPTDLLYAGQLLRFQGTAEDLEDGPLPDAALRWMVGDRLLGTGRLVEARLSAGVYEAALTATDSAGSQATQRVAFQVATPLGRIEAAAGEDGTIRLWWTARQTAVLESAEDVDGPYAAMAARAEIEGDNLVVKVRPAARRTFYRLLLVR